MTAPAIGAFLHPAGRCYALEVTHVFDAAADRLPRVRCRRWGWQEGRVVDDGHRSDCHMLDVRHRGPGCWTSPSYGCDPRRGELWRAVPGPTGQTDLFTAATPSAEQAA